MESKILRVTLHAKPAAATHWSTRTLGSTLGLSATTIRRVWQRNGIKPHLSRSFTCIARKRREAAGCYMRPNDMHRWGMPAQGIVLHRLAPLP